MKKRLKNKAMKTKLLIVLLLFIAGVAYGQKSEVNEYRKWTFTPRVGVALSDYVGREDTYCKQKIGFAGGVEVERRITRLVGISTGAFYSVQGVRSEDEFFYGEIIDLNDNFVGSNMMWPVSIETVLAFSNRNTGVEDFKKNHGMENADHYNFYHNCRIFEYLLDIPLMVNIHPCKGLTVKAGIQADILLNAKAIFDKETYKSAHYYEEWAHYHGERVEHASDTYERNEYKADAKSICNSLTFSIPVGLSYEYRHFELDARYLIGLGNMLTDGRVYFPNFYQNLSRGKEHARNSTFLVTLGYRL